jgi:hypothetical protein
MRRLLTGGALAALALVASCGGDPTGVIRELNVARMRWISRAPNAYEVTVHRGCFCPEAITSNVVVRVRGGVVESRRYAATGADVPADFARAFPSVDEMFGVIAKAESDGAAQIDAKYDAVYGFPSVVYVDYRAEWADDESWFGYTEFRALP